MGLLCGLGLLSGSVFRVRAPSRWRELVVVVGGHSQVPAELPGATLLVALRPWSLRSAWLGQELAAASLPAGATPAEKIWEGLLAHSNFSAAVAKTTTAAACVLPVLGNAPATKPAHPLRVVELSNRSRLPN